MGSVIASVNDYRTVCIWYSIHYEVHDDESTTATK